VRFKPSAEVAGVRPATVLITFNAFLVLLLVLSFVLAPSPSDAGKEATRAFDFTDACISTGEKYVRAAGTTDLSSPVQIYPGALSMYLSEAMVAPPELGELNSSTFDREYVERFTK